MVRYVKPVSGRLATGLTAKVHERMVPELGPHAKPITLHSPAPQISAGASMLATTGDIGKVLVAHVTKLLQSPIFRYIAGVIAMEATEALGPHRGAFSERDPVKYLVRRDARKSVDRFRARGRGRGTAIELAVGSGASWIGSAIEDEHRSR